MNRSATDAQPFFDGGYRSRGLDTIPSDETVVFGSADPDRRPLKSIGPQAAAGESDHRVIVSGVSVAAGKGNRPGRIDARRRPGTDRRAGRVFCRRRSRQSGLHVLRLDLPDANRRGRGTRRAHGRRRLTVVVTRCRARAGCSGRQTADTWW